MKEFAYIALGVVLVLAVMGLRRLKLPKIRLPQIPVPYIKIHRRTVNSVLMSFCGWVIISILLGFTIPVHEIEYDNILVEWVRIPRTTPKRAKPKITPVKPRVTVPKSFAMHRPAPRAKPLELKAAASQSFASIRENVNLSVPDVQTADISTAADIPAKAHEITLSPTGDGGVSRSGKRAGGTGTAPGRGHGTGKRGDGLGGMVGGTGTSDNASLEDGDFSGQSNVPDGELGAILEGEANDIGGHIRLVRLKHSLSDWWQDPTAMPSLFKWLRENTRLRADMKFKGGSMPLTDPDILDAPLIFMTGHDTDIANSRGLNKDGELVDGFTTEERANLRAYIIDRGGMLFFDDCGFNGLFAAQVATELRRIFPEYPLKDIPHNHKIYTCYFTLRRPPQGGDVFWSSPGAGQGRGTTDAGGYRIGTSKFTYQKGIHIGSRLAVVYNRKDYLCAMETAEVDSRASLRSRRSPDVHRFMANLLVYAMKYGGNADRTNYK